MVRKWTSRVMTSGYRIPDCYYADMLLPFPIGQHWDQIFFLVAANLEGKLFQNKNCLEFVWFYP
uniref:Uncharacterized protein n=1 Tax=Solanum tuberosum TaxID=4113 RepID=M1B8Z5_SOLTU